MIAMSSFGCYTIRSIPIRTVSEYPVREAIKGITIAAEAFDSKHSKEVFNHRVNDRGFLPILIIVQNGCDQPVTVNESEIHLKDAMGKIHHRVPARVVAAKFERSPGLEAALLFGMLSFMDANRQNDKMLADWQEKELSQRTIVQPRTTEYGFVYFQAEPREYQKGCSVTVPIVTSDSKYELFRLLLWRTRDVEKVEQKRITPSEQPSSRPDSSMPRFLRDESVLPRISWDHRWPDRRETPPTPPAAAEEIRAERRVQKTFGEMRLAGVACRHRACEAKPGAGMPWALAA